MNLFQAMLNQKSHANKVRNLSLKQKLRYKCETYLVTRELVSKKLI